MPDNATIRSGQTGLILVFLLVAFLVLWLLKPFINVLFLKMVVLPNQEHKANGVRLEMIADSGAETRRDLSTFLLKISEPESNARAAAILQIPESGRYEFRLVCDDAGYLEINGESHIRQFGLAAENISRVQVELSAGPNLLVAGVHNGPGQGSLRLTWRKVGAVELLSLIPSELLYKIDLGNFWTLYSALHSLGYLLRGLALAGMALAASLILRKIDFAYRPDRLPAHQESGALQPWVWFLTIGLMLAGWYLIYLAAALMYKANPRPDLAQLGDLFIPIVLGNFSPEPLERTLYLAFTLSGPLLLMLGFWLVRKRKLPAQASLVLTIISLAAWFGFLAWSLPGSSNNPYTILVRRVGWGSIGLYWLTALGIWFTLRRGWGQSQRTTTLVDFAMFGIALACCAAYLMHETSLRYCGAHAIHLGAVLFPIAEVMAGKVILIDAISQYGLFPHFIAPLLRLTGAEFSNITYLFALLGLLSLTAIYWHLRGFIENRLLIGLTLVAVLFYSTACFYLRSSNPNIFADKYYQYFPIRVLFPVLVLYAGGLYFRRKSLASFVWASVLASAGVFWNFDTGAVAYLSWLIMLGASGFAARDGLRITTLRLLMAGLMLPTLGICWSLWCYFSHGAWPDYGSFFEYQKMFYGNGYFMRPMPWPDPWMALVAVYVIALAVVAAKLASCRKLNPRDLALMHCAMLGVGIFSYYQGRSHTFNLIPVMYPGLMCIGMLLDRALDRDLASLRGKTAALAAAPAFLVLAVPLVFIPQSAPAYWSHVSSDIKDHLAAREMPLRLDVDQVVEQADKLASGADLYVLTGFDWLCLLKLGKGAILPRPDYKSMVRIADYEALVARLGQPGKKVVIRVTDRSDANHPYQLAIDKLLREKYRLAIMPRNNDLGFYCRD